MNKLNIWQGQAWQELHIVWQFFFIEYIDKLSIGINTATLQNVIGSYASVSVKVSISV